MKTKMARGGHRRSYAADVSRARTQWGEVRGQLGVPWTWAGGSCRHADQGQGRTIYWLEWYPLL